MMNPLHVPPYNLKNLYHSALLYGRQKRVRISWLTRLLGWFLGKYQVKVQNTFISVHSALLKAKAVLLFGIGLFCISLTLCGCDVSSEKSFNFSTRRGEYISRMHDDHLEIAPLEKRELSVYPWENKYVGNFPKITKEYFRCKGECLNPNKPIMQTGGTIYVADCEGIRQHSLPLRNHKEFIYPVLIQLLNYIQAKTEKQVIITSGYRCPCHNRYVDPSPKNQYSKHMIGAEVDFYVRGMENAPEKIIDLLQAYFQENPTYQGLAEYCEFQRWEKSECDVSTRPWYNKEVFIKLYKANEGRNFDNAHSHPYIAIQVRYDRDRKERVLYSWEQAFNNYWRY